MFIKALLMLLMICLFTFQSFCCKKYTDTYPGRPELASPVFTVVSGLTVAFVSLCFMGFQFAAVPMTWLLGALNALSLFGYNYFLVKTSQTGPYTVLMVFAIAGDIIIPTISALFFGVIPSPLKWLGVVIVIVGVYVSSYRKNEGEVNLRVFIPSCFGLAFCNGAYAALTDIQQRITGVAEREEMVFATYLIASLLSLLILAAKLLFGGRAEEKADNPGFGGGISALAGAFKQTKISLFFLCITSVIVGLAINLLVIVIGLLNDITMLHVVNNSGILILSAILSYVFLREKITKLNIAGYVIMCGALVLVTLF